MKKLIRFALILVALGTLGGSVPAQGKYKGYKQDRKQARQEYKREIKQARREYRRDVREARRDNNYYGTANRRRYSRPPHGRAYGYRNVRPYVGNRRSAVIRPTRRGYVVRQYRNR